MSRIVTDNMIFSDWNNISVEKGQSKDLVLHFTGLKAFITSIRIRKVERQLLLMLDLLRSVSAVNINVLCHVFVNHTQEKLLILAHDPIDGHAYKYEVKENLKYLPTHINK